MPNYSVQGADGQMYGPVNDQGLLDWARQGRLDRATTVRVEETGATHPAAALPALAAHFAAVLPAPAAYPGYPTAPAYGAPAYPAPAGQLNYAVPSVYAHNPAAYPLDFSEFPVAVAVLLHIFTFGLFSLIWFNLMHDKMPRLRHDDPSGGKGVGFCFIPFFNLYWIFFTLTRLERRIEEQRVARGLLPASMNGFVIASCIFLVFPYINYFIGVPIFGAILAGRLQSRANELARLSRQGYPM